MNENLETTPEENSKVTEDISTSAPSNLFKIFKNPFGHIRAGWRMLVYLLILVSITFPPMFIFNHLKSNIPGGKGIHSMGAIINYILLVSTFTFAVYLTLKLVDKRPFRLLGLWFSPGWFKEYYVGLGFGFATITISFIILWVSNLLDVSQGIWDFSLVLFLLKMFILFAFAGALEELMLRGYLFQAFIEGSNKWIAMLILSVVFSVIHGANPNLSAVGLINIFFAGVMLSIAYIKTRSLWLPIGLHMGWNWTQGPLWGMNVSGTTMENSFLVSAPHGSELLSGGGFGAEGSLIASVIIILITWYIWRAEWIKPSEANSELWKKYPASYRVSPEDSEM